MAQKKMIWNEFHRTGILDSQDARVREFVEHLRTSPAKCWAEIIPEFREKFYDCFDAIVPILAEINDPLIQMVLANNADASKPKEAAILEKMAKEVDADKNPMALKRIAGFKIPAVSRALRARTLPERLIKYVTGE